MRTHGSHGLSVFNSNEWRPVLAHFRQQSVELSKTKAKIAKRIGCQKLEPELTESYGDLYIKITTQE